MINKLQWDEQDLIKHQDLLMGPFQGERTLLGCPENGFVEILVNGA